MFFFTMGVYMLTSFEQAEKRKRWEEHLATRLAEEKNVAALSVKEGATREERLALVQAELTANPELTREMVWRSVQHLKSDEMHHFWIGVVFSLERKIDFVTEQYFNELRPEGSKVMFPGYTTSRGSPFSYEDEADFKKRKCRK